MKKKTTKHRLAGTAAQEGYSASWLGPRARPVAPTASRRAKNARRNYRTEIQQQRPEHSSRPLWRTDVGESLKEGVPTASAQWRSDGMSMVAIGEGRGRNDGRRWS